MAQIIISGGTGYVGRALAGALLGRAHRVRVLARPGSEARIPAGAEAVMANPLDAATFADAVAADDTFVQLTGVAHPAPWKGAQFRAIDQVSCRASAKAARAAGVRHFVYVSVAHPAPVMRTYIQVRRECESLLVESGLLSTILRPWYVLGPGHRWPVVLKPAYALLEAIPATGEAARRLGLVTLPEIVAAMVWAIEHPPERTRVLDVVRIRELASLLNGNTAA